MGASPVARRVVLIIDLALLILLCEPFFRRFITRAVAFNDPFCAAFHIRMDKDLQAVSLILEDIVGAAAHDDAGTLFRQGDPVYSPEKTAEPIAIATPEVTAEPNTTPDPNATAQPSVTSTPEDTPMRTPGPTDAFSG